MKKLLSLILVAVILFSFTSICVSAEEEEEAPAPRYTIIKEVTVTIPKNHRLTNENGDGFEVEIEIDDKNMVAMDGFSDEYTVEITKIQAQKDGFAKITYDPEYVDENPDDESTINPFFEYMAFAEDETRKDIVLYITYQIDFVDAEVFGEISYEISVSGFSAPPDLGGDLGGLLGGATDSLPIPTTVTSKEKITDFPAIASVNPVVSSTKMSYVDSEYVELDGTQVAVTTAIYTYDAEGNITSSTPYGSGTVTYASSNAHMFSTIPAKDERIPEGTTEIATYFAGWNIATLPVVVEHDWSSGPVCITTDKYTENKPGYHAIVCNGCGEAHTAEQHRVDPESWVSNEDETFVANGTASTVCLDCGATLTKDVQSTAGFNTAFANYHFLLVIFEYINLILRIIGTSVG